MRTLCLVLLSAMLWTAPAVQAETGTGWVNDELFVPLRSGADRSYRIVHRGLRSGTELEILDSESEEGWALVRVNDSEGWMETQYISRTPIARHRLARLQQQHEQQTATLRDVREALSSVRTERDQLAEQVATLEQRVEQQDAEMEQLREVAADPAALDEKNRELNEQLSMLRTERDQLQAENELLRNDRTLQGWLLGLLTVFGGMILGWYLKSRGDRARSSWV